MLFLYFFILNMVKSSAFCDLETLKRELIEDVDVDGKLKCLRKKKSRPISNS